MKYIFTILLFYSFSFSLVNATYQVYFNWEYFNNLVINEELHNKIDTYWSGSIYTRDIWYIESDNHYSYNWNIINKLPTWFFSNNIKTIINLDDFNFTENVWFLWINHSYNFNSMDSNNSPVWFFNNTIITKISDSNPIYNTSIWFIVASDLKKNRSSKNIVNEITYKVFIDNILRKETNFDYLKFRYNKSEYNLFINNLLWLLMGWNNYDNLIISEDKQNNIMKNIENSDFNENLSILMNNLKKINHGFKYSNDNFNKQYIIKYFLN